MTRFFLAGALAMSSFASASVILTGSVAFGIRAFFLPSVTYGPYGPLTIWMPLLNVWMYLLF
jgi:hypothetical protein